jgi:predicted nucleotidyltransferase
MTLDELRTTRRETILAIAKRHGVTRVRVFGSFARGEAREDSDLDLLIEAGPNTSAFFPGGLLIDLQDALQRRVEVVEEQGLNHLLRSQILKEAVPLLKALD